MRSFPPPRSTAAVALLACVALWVSVTGQLDAGQTAGSVGSGRLTIDTLVDIKHPSNPVWSRDSKRVGFLWERAGVSNLYVVPADGSAKPVAVTTDGQQVNNVLWSADSSLIYFNRGGALMQVVPDGAHTPEPAAMPARSVVFSPDATKVAYINGNSIQVRTLSTGADRVVTTFDGPIAGLNWTPDGLRLSFTSGGAPGRSVRHEQTPAYSGAKIIYTVTENVAGTPGDAYVVAESGGTPVKFTAGGGGGRGGTRWVDTTHILFDRQSPDFKRRGIYVADATTGEQRLLHEDVKTTFWSITGGAGAGSQVSPGGKWISFLSDQDGWDHIYVMRSQGGQTATQITRGPFEAWRPTWSPDGTRIAFDSNEGPNPGSRHIYVALVDPSVTAAAKPRQLTSGRGADVQPLWSPDGQKILYQRSDPQNSADLYVIDAVKVGATPVRLTDSMPAGINKSLLVEPQLINYPGPDGQKVPAYLFVPKTLNRAVKHPAIVWIHGDGINQNYDGWHIQRNYAVYYSIHQYLLQKGYVVIAPDYRGSIGYGAAWRDGVYMDVGGKDFRDAALAANYLKTLPYVDSARLGVWGLSYGGFFTLLAVTEYPTMYRAAIDVAGVADYAMYYDDPYHGSWTESRIGKPDQNPQVYAQASPVSNINKLVRPLLVLHGTADVNVPYLHSVKLIDEALKHGKGDLVEFMTYPGEFHYFTREHVLKDAWSRVERFFAAHLKP
jgi:dipeptidyl aminopeptidase/acylaminoacyl peptidase